ncbi:hypothetical protein Tco_1238121 [Tanacetum coccineum]
MEATQFAARPRRIPASNELRAGDVAYLEIADPDEVRLFGKLESPERSECRFCLPDQRNVCFSLLLLLLLSESECFMDSSARAEPPILYYCGEITTVAVHNFHRAAATLLNWHQDVNPGLVPGPSHPEESEGSDDSFYFSTILDPSEVKRWVGFWGKEERFKILKLKSHLRLINGGEGGGKPRRYPPS